MGPACRRMLLAAEAEIDAVFCGSDQIARGVAEALREAGRDIPRDVALVGFDNWDALTDAARPTLTSVDMDLEGIGRQAAELLQAINGDVAHGAEAAVPVGSPGLHRGARLTATGTAWPAAVTWPGLDHDRDRDPACSLLGTRAGPVCCSMSPSC